MKPYSSKHHSTEVSGNLPISGKSRNKTRKQFKRYFKKSLRFKLKKELQNEIIKS